MTQSINNTHHVNTNNWPCVKVIASLVIITSVVLAIIGILAGLEIYGLYGIADFWFLFEIAAVATFILGAICCCRCFCDARKVERHQRQPRGNHEEISPTAVQHQPSATALSPAEQVFVSGLISARGKDFAGAAQCYRHAWETYGYFPAGLELANAYEQGNGVAKDPKAAQQIYTQLSRHHCMEAIFCLAQNAFKTGNVASGITWLEYAVSVDYDRDRAGHLGRTLQLHQPAQFNINRQTFTHAETRATADQLNAVNEQIVGESRRTAYLSLASQYVLQEQAKRQAEHQRLLAAQA